MALTDAEIIGRSLDDPNLFGVVFDRYHDDIFRFVARRVGVDVAADLTADVFTRAFSLRDRYDVTREFCRPWLYGIALNIVGDEIRCMQRSERLSLAMLGLQMEDGDDPFGRVDDQLVAEQQAASLNRSLAKLFPGDRSALLLYAVEELTYQEIGDVLDIPVGTVRSRLSRARHKMRELVDLDRQTTNREQ